MSQNVDLTTELCMAYNIHNTRVMLHYLLLLSNIWNILLNILSIVLIKMQTPSLAEWLSWLNIILYTKRLQVRFLVRPHTQVVGMIPGQGVQKIDVCHIAISLCFSLSLTSPSLKSISISLDEDFFLKMESPWRQVLSFLLFHY